MRDMSKRILISWWRGRALAPRAWLAAVGLAAAGMAQAGDLVWSVGIHQPGVSVQVGNARPVIVASPVVVSPPAVVVPAPVTWVAPTVTWMAPPPVVLVEAPRRPHHRHHHGHGGGHRHGEWAAPGVWGHPYGLGPARGWRHRD